MSAQAKTMTATGDTPLWHPTEKRAADAHMTAFMQQASERSGRALTNYDALWDWSVNEIEDFWTLVWDYCGIIGDRGARVLKDGDKMPGAQFFPDAQINYAENLLRRRDDTPALIFRAEHGAERTLSWAQLYDEVSRFTQALKDAGVGQGDRVAGYMPNMPEAIIGMLATAALGAIWSSASPDFGAQGVLDRFGQTEPTVMLAVDGYFYNGKTVDCLSKIRDVQPQLPSLKKTIIVPFVNQQPDLKNLSHTHTYADFIAPFTAGDIAFNRVPFNHPLYIMFSSGTTGIPKCIVHGAGGTLLQQFKEHRLHCDLSPGDRIFYFTTCGWMMWNWLAGALAAECTLLLYDGSPFYPDPLSLWDFTSQHHCKLFGTGAKYIDALKAHGVRPADHFDLSHLQTMTSTGSPLVHESFDYVYDAIKSDLHLASISGGTDIVSCFVLGNPLGAVWRGEIQCAGLGMATDVFAEDGTPIASGAGAGELVCTKPFPSMPVKFWNDEDGARYKAAYFERFDNIWCHGDWVERTAHGGFIIHGRSDATLNPGGVRIGTAEIYRQVEQIPEVFESIAVGQDFAGDVRVILFVRLKDNATLTDELRDRIKKIIRNGTSPRHVPAKVIAVTDIPRTKSNKITELAVRDMIH
ncbi:MAG: acetoacetate--CoA ligase, partial [Alphaproteobacteria bacterium]|nr:acetoacetate--CoA ligase [Alphaproteobacteria bacterium]